MSLPSDFPFGVFALVRGDKEPFRMHGPQNLSMAMEALAILRNKQKSVGFKV